MYEDEYGDEGPDEKQRKKKRMILAAAICFCIFILGGLGAILGAVFAGDGDDSQAEASNTNSPVTPTPAPTTSAPARINIFPPTPPPILPPAAPFPTISPTGLVTETVITATDDQSIQIGNVPNETFGDQDTLYIYKGQLDTADAFQSYVVMAFNLTAISSSAIDSRMLQEKTATLRVYHVPSDSEREAVNMTVSKFEETNATLETLNVDNVTVGPTFSVNPSDGPLEIDITELIYGGSEDVDESQLFLKLEYAEGIDTGAADGDYFRSLEYDDGRFAAQVILDVVPTPVVPTSAPSFTPSSDPSTAVSSSPSAISSAFPTSDVSSAPSAISSAFPTAILTASMLPTAVLRDTYTITTYADTSIQSGPGTDDEIFGTGDFIYIQNGELAQNNFQSYGIMAFDLTEIPLSAYTFLGSKSARLVLHHLEPVVEKAQVEITVSRLPEIPLGSLAIETLSGQTFVQDKSSEVVGPTFSVSPSTNSRVEVDITDLVFEFNGPKENKLFLKIENNGEFQLQDTGDQFYSREYEDGEFAPEVMLDFVAG